MKHFSTCPLHTYFKCDHQSTISEESNMISFLNTTLLHCHCPDRYNTASLCDVHFYWHSSSNFTKAAKYLISSTRWLNWYKTSNWEIIMKCPFFSLDKCDTHEASFLHLSTKISINIGQHIYWIRIFPTTLNILVNPWICFPDSLMRRLIPHMSVLLIWSNRQ